MKDVRFYLEYPNKQENHKATRKNLGNHGGNVIAVFYQNDFIKEKDMYYDCLMGLLFKRNSPVVGSSVPQSYLSEKCKRISEQQAREIHPALFERLDN